MDVWQEHAWYMHDPKDYPPAYREAIKEVSIRGRVALGTVCLEALCKSLGVDDVRVRASIAQFRDYTSATRLDLWSDEMWHLIEWAIKIVEENTGSPDSAVYQGLPMSVLRTLYDVYDVATINLYGGTGEWSPGTLAPALAILDRLRVAKLTWPDLGTFIRSSFGEAGGWGLPEDSSRFG